MEVTGNLITRIHEHNRSANKMKCPRRISRPSEDKLSLFTVLAANLRKGLNSSLHPGSHYALLPPCVVCSKVWQPLDRSLAAPEPQHLRSGSLQSDHHRSWHHHQDHVGIRDWPGRRIWADRLHPLAERRRTDSGVFTEHKFIT